MSETGPTAQVAAVRGLHSKREFNGDGYGWAICAEDRQAWPCATVQAIEATTCPICNGEGWEVVPEMQCGDEPHDCGDGCAIPVQVPCRCTKTTTPTPSGEEPF